MTLISLGHLGTGCAVVPHAAGATVQLSKEIGNVMRLPKEIFIKKENIAPTYSQGEGK